MLLVIVVILVVLFNNFCIWWKKLFFVVSILFIEINCFSVDFIFDIDLCSLLIFLIIECLDLCFLKCKLLMELVF